MILTCPSCDTQYFADEATLTGTERMVRCAACGHSWEINTPAGSAGLDNPSVAHAAMREKMREKRAALNNRIAIYTWVSMAAIFCLFIGALGIWRNQVVQAWPQSASAYQAVGLDVNRFGVTFVSHDKARTFDGTTPILRVWGNVRNTTGRPVVAPRVMIRMRSDDQEDVGFVTTAIEPLELPANAIGEFRTTLRNPPIDSFKLELTFIPENEAAELAASQSESQ